MKHKWTELNAHTPGPWKASVGTGYVAIMAGPTIDRQLAITTACNPEGCANARLIAAAPELLAALERINRVIGWITSMGSGPTRDEAIERLHCDRDFVLRQCAAAIAKARGEA